jgi:hypothetical protein
MTIGANGKWTKLLLRLSRQKLAPVLSRVRVALILPADKEIQIESGCSKNANLRTFYSTGTTDILSSNLDFPGNIQTQEQKY